jgi:hypothetical protein
VAELATDGGGALMVERFAETPSIMTGIVIEHFHGAVTRAPSQRRRSRTASPAATSSYPGHGPTPKTTTPTLPGCVTLEGAKVEVVGAVEGGCFPFDGSLIARRPDPSLSPATLPVDWDQRPGGWGSRAWQRRPAFDPAVPAHCRRS